MISGGTHTAVVDEIEDSLARLELEDADGDLHEVVLDIAELPPAGRKAGAVLTIEYADDEIAEVNYEPGATKRGSGDAEDRFNRLSRRPNEDQ